MNLCASKISSPPVTPCYTVSSNQQFTYGAHYRWEAMSISDVALRILQWAVRWRSAHSRSGSPPSSTRLSSRSGRTC